MDPAIQGLEVYVVGGAVRDKLLGLPAGDRDWVVVGGTPEDMTARGFLPVGGDFPVFLHPVSKEEYALARTERKSGRGYKGFTFYTGPDVTLEDDLRRRDLTVNAIAQAPDGSLIDPWDGHRDIERKVLRHVGEAFAEDPVRLLRLARFAARFADFSVASETMALSRRLVDEGEVDALVPERVWREVAKGLQTRSPARMFDVLAQAGALARIMPGLRFDEEIARQLDCAVRADLALAQRFALLCRKSPEPELIGRHVRAPSECIDYARLLPALAAALEGLHKGAETAGGASSNVDALHAADGTHALAPGRMEAWLDLIERNDGLRKPQRFLNLLQAAQCVTEVDLPGWRQRLDAVRAIDAGAVAKAAGGEPERIKAALRQARLDALRRSP
ncbi:tRNA CCA-pyrophosphorylase [Pusillimonas caeni]|uniref:tRNA CCA-pyrophosphorylase n=1 Tax=Pusillimonas caeni TaxID=1348472 RepID=UPI000E599F03|nr:tRNA CCA-pyrophosphorylase [Pusillimonas caeni]TFL14945.1 tRNA CCA-pyrophosphorylase [Pusillimonas caeni]